MDMRGTYEACIHLREISKQQRELADEMALIALNAEVAAAKSTVNKEAFIVLANETGQIARLMSQAMEALQSDADALARTSLVGMEKARQLDRLQEGHSGIRTARNAAVVGTVVERVRALVAETMGTLRAKLEHLEDGEQRIARQLTRVARIITYFRIEASRDDQFGAYFRHIADDLTRLHDTARGISEAMRAVLQQARAVGSEREGMRRGLTNSLG